MCLSRRARLASCLSLSRPVPPVGLSTQKRKASGRPFRRGRFPVYALRVTLSVVLITHNEEGNLARTLESVMPLVRNDQGEIIVVDSGSTDRTIEIAKSFGARVFPESWKGFAAQKNSAIEKATRDWTLSLDADEVVSSEF